jgi:hypothetical protein
MDVLEEHVTSIFSSCYLLHAGFLLGLFFNSEDGGNSFPQNIGSLSIDYVVLLS